MNIPPLIIGGAVLFWGAETGRMLIGVVLFLLLEGRSLVKVRYDFDEDDFVKISDLTSLVFLGTVALVLLNYEPLGFLRITVSWLPLVLFPLAAAQLYSTGDTVTIGTRLGAKKRSYTHKPVDIRIYYIVVCIFAAATGNSGSSLFLPGTCLIYAVLFYSNRGKSNSLALFLGILVISLSLAYGISGFMVKAHRFAANQSIQFIYSYYKDKYGDPYWTNVKFGDTGRLKNSGKIIMRVDSPAPPLLLKVASYEEYSRGSWFGNKRGYTHLPPRDEESWDLMEPPHGDGRKISVEYGLPKEKGLVPAPGGSFALKSTTISELAQKADGSMRVTEGAPIITYTIGYDPGRVKKTDTPEDKHLGVPRDEGYALDLARERLSVSMQSGSEKVSAVAEFFGRGFTYSLSLVGAGEYATPLGNFLLEKKSGFCEYYATATVLLLRSMGIPSRYAVGYAVTEWSRLEEKFIVRQRHAHAWAEAFVDGRWVVVDTTPSEWIAKDEDKASLFEPVRDFFNFLRHKYRLYQLGSSEDYTLHFSIAVVVLTAFLVIRIYRRMKMEQAEDGGETEPLKTFTRVKTPFTPVVDFLEKSAAGKSRRESFAEWAGRVYSWRDFDEQEFAFLYQLHLKKRFDPNGLDESGYKLLQIGAEKYLEDISAAKDQAG